MLHHKGNYFYKSNVFFKNKQFAPWFFAYLGTALSFKMSWLDFPKPYFIGESQCKEI